MSDIGIDSYIKSVINKLQEFESLDLSEINKLSLMDRVDVKYVVPLPLLYQILDQCQPQYKVLEINEERLHDYDTQYYDTHDFKLYSKHQAGHLNRFKIRTRKYQSTAVSFLEIKHKTNKQRTIKSRVGVVDYQYKFEGKENVFISATSGIIAEDLKPNLHVHYKRFTLLNVESQERITIDVDLTFSNMAIKKSYGQVVIIEVKQNKIKKSFFTNILKELQVAPGSISKYCLGCISLYPHLKMNRFKLKLTKFHKKLEEYDFITSGT